MNDSTSQRGIAVLGSTGSIGSSTLDVIRALPERFRIVALAASTNYQQLQEQIDRFRPMYVACGEHGSKLDHAIVVDGDDQLSVLATLAEVDIVVVATTGHGAIQPTIDALRAGKIVALANKESIVAAGEIVMQVAREGPGTLRPVDSEHSAIWQCLCSCSDVATQVNRLILTASGGPFRGWTLGNLRDVTPEQALRHPKWSMGNKITIDSATLMNKGLEVIEAHWLFDIALDRIEVVIHPQSLVHSCVEFVDGAIVAQFGAHDMRLPIQFALTYPDRINGPADRLNLLECGRLDFETPDEMTFPLLGMAREAARLGGTYPTVLSAADAVAVDAFLSGAVRFDEIPLVVQTTMDGHHNDSGQLSIESIIVADSWASATAQEIVRRR